ncbi:hypothetical protein GALL_372190 [mine drainage metagenome]|uniref:Uncharacterized protein n=1 Tax=mine drainage metagenome TaxID=410659 RepID=A0A1J5QCT6_9ZZZZ
MKLINPSSALYNEDLAPATERKHAPKAVLRQAFFS